MSYLFPKKQGLRARSRAPWAAILLSLQFAGCRSATDIEGSDEFVVFPVLRTSFQVLPRHQQTLGDILRGVPPPPPSRIPNSSPSLAFDLEFSYAQGDLDQSLQVGEEIDFKDLSISGPAPVAAESELFQFSISSRGGIWYRDKVAVEPLVGLGWSYNRLEVKSGIQQGRDYSWSIGPLGGMQIRVYPIQWLGLYALGTIYGGFGEGDSDFISIGRGEVGMIWNPLAGISFLGGWRWLSYREERHSGSDVDFDLSGPLLGLQLIF